jgi:hypothetical protein
VKKALSDEDPARELRWAPLLAGPQPGQPAPAKAPAKKRAKAPNE